MAVIFIGTSIASAADGTINITLKYGMNNIQVKYLQQMLNEKGYTIASSGIGSKGMESSFFGPATMKAVKLFQSSKSLVADQENRK